MIEDSKHYALAITCGAKRGPKDSDLTFSPAALRDFLKAIEQAEQAQQPVAQVHLAHLRPAEDESGRWCREVLLYSGNHEGDKLDGKNHRVKLYTTPQPRQPLTDEEIGKCYETTGHYQTLRPQDRFAVFALARAIERAHGIKGEA